MMMGMTFLAAWFLASGGSCFMTARLIEQGAVLSAADLTPVACKPAARPPLRYDTASGGPVALAAMPAGTYLGRLAPVSEAPVRAGTDLTLRSSAGVVTIERRVTAIQSGRAGDRIFVRDSSGEVFAVPLALDAQ